MSEKAEACSLTVLHVAGISCMDCAQNFEKAVNQLPGVVKASLNAMSGKLTVEGEADLAAIQRLGAEENYTIHAEGEEPARQERKADWELRRAVLSGVALAVAYALEFLSFSSSQYLPAYVIATLLGGWDNFKKAGRALSNLHFNMSVLMSAAVFGAFAIGQYEEGAAVAFLFAISEMLEAWTVDRARRSIRGLMDMAPAAATVRRSGEEQELAVRDILIGDVMIVRPGERIAMDGRIIKGISAINQSAITGEAIPVDKGPGDEIFAGTLNTSGALEVEVTKLIQDTTIARIIHMVEQAQGRRAPVQAFVERFAAVYTPLVIVMALGIILVPPLLFSQEWMPWIYRGLSLMVVACPCALVISTPVAIVSAISNAARNGVLIKGGVHLEQMADIQVVAFDKTGTLTKGQPVVTDIRAFSQLSTEQLLAKAAGLEAHSEHPLAKAIVQEAAQQKLSTATAEAFTALPGLGAQGNLEGETLYVGNARLFAQMGVSMEEGAAVIAELQGEGKTVMLVGTHEKLYGLLAVADEVRAETAGALAQLRSEGVSRTVMLTGDHLQAAQAVAVKAGVDEFQAELLPEDKVAAIDKLLGNYGKTVMVGDGINDAPALAAATVGIAMGRAGTDTALETADIALMSDDLNKIPFTIKLSRATLKIIRQNISFALAIKGIALLAVFPGWLTLWLAILADMGATILVTLNSLRILQVKAK